MELYGRGGTVGFEHLYVCFSRIFKWAPVGHARLGDGGLSLDTGTARRKIPPVPELETVTVPVTTDDLIRSATPSPKNEYDCVTNKMNSLYFIQFNLLT